jgi:hypothetical protein
MASAFCTGPALIYCGVGAGYSPAFLGTAERGVRMRIKRHFSPVMNDLAGDEPYDWSYLGQGGLLMATLTRWNEAVYAAMAAAANPFLNTRGSDVSGDTGTLMLTEGVSYPVWVRFPYAVKTAYVAAGMPAGYRWYSCFLMGPDDLDPVGTQPRKLHLVWYASRSYSVLLNKFVLYDHDMNGLPVFN